MGLDHRYSYNKKNIYLYVVFVVVGKAVAVKTSPPVVRLRVPS